MSVYDYQPLSWHGTKSQILASLVSCPQDTDLNSTAAAPALSVAKGVSGDGGRSIVETGATGLSYLRSDLSYSEAEAFLSALQLTPTSPDQIKVTPIAVFMGQVSIQYFPAASTGIAKVGSVPSMSETLYNGGEMAYADVLNANLSISGSSNAAKSYQVFCSASLRTKSEEGS